MKGDRKTPLSLAVFFVIIVLGFVVVVGASVGVSVALSFSAIHHAQVTETQLQVREAQSQLRASIPTCEAIDRFDKASHLPRRDFPRYPHDIYDMRLASAIHDVNIASRCPAILADLAKHEPLSEILAQLRQL